MSMSQVSMYHKVESNKRKKPIYCCTTDKLCYELGSIFKHLQLCECVCYKEEHPKSTKDILYKMNNTSYMD